MKRSGFLTTVCPMLVAILALAGAAFAHGDNDHLRGLVTAIAPHAVTIQMTDKSTKTLTMNDKTTFEMSGKTARLADLKIGDRVVIDVPKKTSEARLIKFGAPAAAKATPKH